MKTNLLRKVPLLLIAIVASGSLLHADDTDATSAKTAALASMQSWFAELDAHEFAQCWNDSSKSLQGAITLDKWQAALSSVVPPLGKMISRQNVSALYQTSIPTPGGKTLSGQFVIAQFNSSFENLKYAVETVTFEKDADGVWRDSGYYIKPGS